MHINLQYKYVDGVKGKMVEDNHAYQTQQFKKKKLFYFGKSKNVRKKVTKKLI